MTIVSALRKLEQLYNLGKIESAEDIATKFQKMTGCTNFEWAMGAARSLIARNPKTVPSVSSSWYGNTYIGLD